MARYEWCVNPEHDSDPHPATSACKHPSGQGAAAGPPPVIGVPYAWTDPETGAKTCPECGDVFAERYDADDKPVTFNYATHYQTAHQEHR